MAVTVVLVLVTKVVLEDVVVVAVLVEGPVKVVDVVELVKLLDVDEELVEELEELMVTYVETAWPGQLTTPFVAYKLNWKAPPQNAVPVVAAPIEPLQTSVQAWAPDKLVTAEEPKLKTLPP